MKAGETRGNKETLGDGEGEPRQQKRETEGKQRGTMRNREAKSKTRRDTGELRRE